MRQDTHNTKALHVLWEDEHCLVIYKEAGLLVHRSKSTSTREESLLERAREHAGGSYVYPVHRLDRGTSGVILFAKNKEASHLLMQQFRERTVEKRYLAVTRGWIADRVELDYPLPRLESLDEKREEAQTHFQALARMEIAQLVDRYPQSRYSLVLAEPQSGRRHQIRRHLKHLRYPIVGDITYGHGPHNRFFREDFSCSRLLLHAWTLRFKSLAGEELSISADWDADFARVLTAFAWNTAGHEGANAETIKPRQHPVLWAEERPWKAL